MVGGGGGGGNIQQLKHKQNKNSG